ncbi:SDR family NAD(P)-dependent oxidoreductase [candidate division KSB1 bacterium]|nr:MAG: SDR family NAD(P)-dependent oxidoreductase [candidate division KSB1 bacterium]
MRVLVTGGAGFIGSHTTDALLAKGYDVTILDSLEKPVHLKGKPSYIPAKVRFLEGDVRNREDMLNALQGVEAVFHFAAYQDYLPDFSKFFHVNSVGTALIFELIVEKKLPVKKVIVASSQAVAGEGLYHSASGEVFRPDLRPLAQLEAGDWDFRHPSTSEILKWKDTPETHANPQNQYALSKYSQELMTLAFGKRYDIPSAAMRFSIVQGPRQSFYNNYSGACRIFSLSYFFNRAPLIYEDGMQVRDYVNIHDVVDANLLVLEDNRACYEMYNVGGGKPYTVQEFCAIVAKEFGREGLAPRIPGLFRFGDTRHIVSDISKLQALGWNPKRSPQESVHLYREYLEQQTDVDDIMDYAERNMKSLNVVRESRKAASR